MLRAVLVAAMVLIAGAAGAETLGEKLRAGTQKAGQAVKNTADKVGQTVDSTVDLAKKDPDPAITRAKLDRMAEETLAKLFATNPAARAQFDISAGYAVFDTRKATLFGAVAGFGKGVAVSNDTGARTYMNMGTGGVGLAFGFGGFESQVVILFQDTYSFNDFVTRGYDATAQAAARAGEDKAEEALRFYDGRSIFVLGKNGWRVSASAAGTKYWAAPDLNAVP
jgi:hypothetical protein